jgi:repressor LexA
MKLTSRQRDIYDFIEGFMKKFQYAPSTREIQTRFGFKSQTAAVNHLKALTDKGFIKRPSVRSRKLILLK